MGAPRGRQLKEGTMKKLVTLAALALVLTGCTAAPDAAPSESATPTATVEAATSEQVASVLAEYEPTWREVIADAGECRFTWTLGDAADVTTQLEGLSCYTTEKTIGITSQLVVRDWTAMDIPADLQGLVDETSAVLELISDVDLTAVCGDEEVPDGSDTCNAGLGSRYAAYRTLDSQLNKWSPYL
jgi:hypothetical protein